MYFFYYLCYKNKKLKLIMIVYLVNIRVFFVFIELYLILKCKIVRMEEVYFFLYLNLGLSGE